MIISRSRTQVPLHPPLYISGGRIDEVASFYLLKVTFDSKLTFEQHIRSLSSSIAQKAGLLQKCFKTFGRNSFVLKSFYVFTLLHFSYSTAVWMSAANFQLELLDRAFNLIK